MSYTQLTQEERYQISILMKEQYNQTEIARLLGRNKSTISREIRRNQGLNGYHPKQAHYIAQQRSQGKVRPRINSKVWQQVDQLIREEWSPEQICGRLVKEQGHAPSHEWIYQYIYTDKWSGGDLYRHLRCQKKRRKRYGSGYNRRGSIPNRVSIDERPAVVNNKRRFGDWEGDTVIGKSHKGLIATLVERKSKFSMIVAMKNKSAKTVHEAVVRGLMPYKGRVHTITYDNGPEFTDHEKIAKDLDAKIYFAHPYASWERGLNENTNGLIRQYLPKNRELLSLSEREVNQIMDKLNNRPRKSLGFQTPFEVFFKKKTSLTVALNS